MTLALKFNILSAEVNRWEIVILFRDTGESVYRQSPVWFDMYIQQHKSVAECGKSLLSSYK